MLQFQRIRLADRERLEPLLLAAPDRGCEYTFGNIYIWHDVYCTDLAFTEDGLCVVRFACEVDAYLFPVGAGNVEAAIRDMLADSASRGIPFRIIAARREDTELLDKLFPGQFRHHLNRDYAEYVYNSADLIELAGKKYHGKRNHIAQFLSAYPDYQFHEISRDSIDAVRAMNDDWYRAYMEINDDSLHDEQTAANYAFENFFELGLSGGYITAGGRILAFAIGEPINADTFCVHIEKGCYEAPGAYAVINRDFARHFCAGYRYINREDDLGVEGLRRAKLSYNPALITEKYVVNCDDTTRD